MAVLSGRRGVAVIATALLTAGCGTSVADADGQRPSPTTPAAPASPFCVAAGDQTDALRPLVALTQSGAVPADRLAAAVDAVRRSNTELVMTAPADLLADVQQYVDTLNQQLDALTRAGGDPRDPTVLAASGPPEGLAAAQRVTAYIMTSCPQRS